MTSDDLEDPMGTTRHRAPTAEQAAEIRARAWTASMRKVHREVPRYYGTCACHGGPSMGCTQGHHTGCTGTTPLRSVETYICSTSGQVLSLPEPYLNLTDTSRTGPHRTAYAQVWLADRVCRWVCPCTCHTGALPAVQDALF